MNENTSIVNENTNTKVEENQMSENTQQENHVNEQQEVGDKTETEQKIEEQPAEPKPVVKQKVDMKKVAEMQMKAAEDIYRERYPNLNIKEGSFVQTKDDPFWANKVRCIVICGCDKEVERATSDLHTFIGCEECKKHVRKLNKMKKKAGLVG